MTTPGSFFGHGGPANHERSRITPAQRTEIARRYADGETAASIAADMGISAGIVRNNVVTRQPGGAPRKRV
jgi:transposase-like protein